MGFTSAIKRHSKTINVLFSAALIALCIFCYAVLIVLYLSPQSFHIRSLVYVEDATIKPTVVVGLVTALFSGATSALATRAVEHSLWLQLAPYSTKKPLTASESHRLAQWSTSPLARALYLFDGSSWLLKIGGPLLFGLAALNPVLLLGISQAASTSSSSDTTQPTLPNFAGFLDVSNSQYNGGNFHDNLMTTAALAYLSNLTAPASQLCNSDSSCTATAQAAAIFATCKSYDFDNSKGLGVPTAQNAVNGTFCSYLNPGVCVTLQRNSPSTFVNFTTGFPSQGCETGTGTCNVGDWAVLAGAWVNIIGESANQVLPVHFVDCMLQWGNVTITQEGPASPDLKRSSFVKSPYTLGNYSGGAGTWRRIYTEGYASPFIFSGASSGTGANTLYASSLGSLLINYGQTSLDTTLSSSDKVARQIENSFDMGTKFAFARKPQASTVTVTLQDEGLQEWRYDPIVLLVLLIPLLATFCGLANRWRVGDDDTVIGYDPVKIVEAGPAIRSRVTRGDGDSEYGEVWVSK